MKTLTLTEAQFRAVYDALGQYVENGEEAEEVELGSSPNLAAAQEVLETLDLVVSRRTG